MTHNPLGDREAPRRDAYPRAPSRLEFRAYRPTDLNACLDIFASNIPGCFAEAERAEFASFLSVHGSTYLVVETRGVVAACGGSSVQGETGRLCWGMVARSQQGAAIGTALLVHRLDDLFCRKPKVLEVGIDTSQHTAGFFERFGFTTRQVTPDGFAKGIDRVAMALRRENWLANRRWVSSEETC
jgi:ribosomal protein S18 acetylase RimI-like enzyme